MDMARNLKNVENETQTLQDLEYGEKNGNEKTEKFTWQDLEHDKKQ